jgi:hypothetical protein
MKSRTIGEAVQATFQGKTVPAEVVLVSKTGLPAALCFDAMLGGYVGCMPLIERDDALYDLFCDELVIIEDLRESKA